MLRLTQTQTARDAKRLADALLVRGIEAQTRSPREGEPTTEVWVHDHARMDEARALLEPFARGALDDAAKDAARLRRERARGEEDWAHRFHDLGRRWHVSKSTRDGFGIVTVLLIVASVIVGFAGNFGDPPDARMWNLTLDTPWSTEPLQAIREGEVWRLITPIFLHFGVVHLLFNMMWVARLGTMIERNHGTVVMLALVLVSATVGNLGQYLASGPAFGGMSGVAYALFGFVWMHARFDPRHAYDMPGSSVVFMMIWFLLCATGTVGHIANLGHAGGLAVGLLFGLPPYVRHLLARTTRPDFEQEGAWAAIHRTRWQRWRRRFIEPWVPLWFLGMIAWVVAFDPGLHRDPYEQLDLDPCTEAYVALINPCLEQADQATYQALSEQMSDLALQLDVFGEHWRQQCPEYVERLRPIVERHGCDPSP